MYTTRARQFYSPNIIMSDSDVEAGPSSRPLDMAYNPDQDPDEKRRVRGHYRQLQADLDGTVKHISRLEEKDLID